MDYKKALEILIELMTENKDVLLKLKETKMLMELYQGFWKSTDFECDLEMEFPSEYEALKLNEKIPTENLTAMHTFMENYSAFN